MCISCRMSDEIVIEGDLRNSEEEDSFEIEGDPVFNDTATTAATLMAYVNNSNGNTNTKITNNPHYIGIAPSQNQPPYPQK